MKQVAVLGFLLVVFKNLVEHVALCWLLGVKFGYS